MALWIKNDVLFHRTVGRGRARTLPAWVTRSDEPQHPGAGTGHSPSHINLQKRKDREEGNDGDLLPNGPLSSPHVHWARQQQDQHVEPQLSKRQQQQQQQQQQQPKLSKTQRKKQRKEQERLLQQQTQQNQQHQQEQQQMQQQIQQQQQQQQREKQRSRPSLLASIRSDLQATAVVVPHTYYAIREFIAGLDRLLAEPTTSTEEYQFFIRHLAALVDIRPQDDEWMMYHQNTTLYACLRFFREVDDDKGNNSSDKNFIEEAEEHVLRQLATSIVQNGNVDSEITQQWREYWNCEFVTRRLELERIVQESRSELRTTTILDGIAFVEQQMAFLVAVASASPSDVLYFALQQTIHPYVWNTIEFITERRGTETNPLPLIPKPFHALWQTAERLWKHNHRDATPQDADTWAKQLCNEANLLAVVRELEESLKKAPPTNNNIIDKKNNNHTIVTRRAIKPKQVNAKDQKFLKKLIDTYKELEKQLINPFSSHKKLKLHSAVVSSHNARAIWSQAGMSELNRLRCQAIQSLSQSFIDNDNDVTGKQKKNDDILTLLRNIFRAALGRKLGAGCPVDVLLLSLQQLQEQYHKWWGSYKNTVWHLVLFIQESVPILQGKMMDVPILQGKHEKVKIWQAVTDTINQIMKCYSEDNKETMLSPKEEGEVTDQPCTKSSGTKVMDKHATSIEQANCTPKKDVVEETFATEEHSKTTDSNAQNVQGIAGADNIIGNTWSLENEELLERVVIAYEDMEKLVQNPEPAESCRRRLMELHEFISKPEHEVLWERADVSDLDRKRCKAVASLARTLVLSPLETPESTRISWRTVDSTILEHCSRILEGAALPSFDAVKIEHLRFSLDTLCMDSSLEPRLSLFASCIRDLLCFVHATALEKLRSREGCSGEKMVWSPVPGRVDGILGLLNRIGDLHSSTGTSISPEQQNRARSNKRPAVSVTVKEEYSDVNKSNNTTNSTYLNATLSTQQTRSLPVAIKEEPGSGGDEHAASDVGALTNTSLLHILDSIGIKQQERHDDHDVAGRFSREVSPEKENRKKPKNSEESSRDEEPQSINHRHGQNLRAVKSDPDEIE